MKTQFFSEKKSFGIPCHIQEDIMNMGLKDAGCEDGDWVHLAYDRHPWRALVNTV
jgi:hypothetical protein